MSTVKNIGPYKKQASSTPARALFEPFARRRAAPSITVVTVCSFLLMCLVVAASIVYTPHVRSTIFSFVEEANATLEVANEAMFGTYMQIAGAAAAMVVPAQKNNAAAPPVMLTATYISAQ